MHGGACENWNCHVELKLGAFLEHHTQEKGNYCFIDIKLLLTLTVAISNCRNFLFVGGCIRSFSFFFLADSSVFSSPVHLVISFSKSS